LESTPFALSAAKIVVSGKPFGFPFDAPGNVLSFIPYDVPACMYSRFG
jgi:hypothetical protein